MKRVHHDVRARGSHLRLVRAIVEDGGPTRAAARLHLTQSAVSHQLSELEGRLGVALFTRVHRRLQPTAAGKRLLGFARTALADFSRIERELQHAGTRKRETVRISTEAFTSYHWLPSVLAKVREDYPQVDVRIVIEATRAPIAALLRGELELAVVSSNVRDRQLVVERLFDDEWVVIVPPAHQRWAVAPHEASGQIVTRRFTKAGMKVRWSAVYNRRDAGPRLILARLAELLRATPPTLSARARLA